MFVTNLGEMASTESVHLAGAGDKSCSMNSLGVPASRRQTHLSGPPGPLN